jgi:hypothetical protein
MRLPRTIPSIANPAGAPARPSVPLGDLRFRALVGARQWARLPAAVRRRFSKRLAGGATAVYIGEVTTARLSRLGWLLAQALRMIGGPLPVGTNVGMPAIVSVTEDRDGQGQIWTRVYGRQSGFPQVIHSAKRFRGPTGLEEYLGYGFGMALRAEASETGLRFRGDHYFIELAGVRLRIPRWFGPGAVTIRHIDLGAGRFNFVLELHHPLFGELVRQVATFADYAPSQGD